MGFIKRETSGYEAVPIPLPLVIKFPASFPLLFLAQILNTTAQYNQISYQSYPAKPILAPGEDSAYERGGDPRRKVWIKPLKETDLGVAQAFFDP